MSAVTDQPHPNPAVEALAKTYRNLYREVYQPLMDQLSHVSREAMKIPNKGISTEDAVDLGFLCREIENLFDECRKEAKARHERIARLIAQDLVDKVMSGSEVDDPLVRGLYASGSPNVGVTPKVPKKGTQGYFDLCKHLGIPIDLANRGLVVFHYPLLVELCTELAQEGKPMPPGLVGSASKVTTTFRKLRNDET